MLLLLLLLLLLFLLLLSLSLPSMNLARIHFVSKVRVWMMVCRQRGQRVRVMWLMHIFFLVCLSSMCLSVRKGNWLEGNSDGWG